MKLSRRFTFSASHSLPGNFPEGSPNAGIHGHTYRVTITVAGPVNRKTGWVCDSSKLAQLWYTDCFPFLDHKNLDTVMKVPTAENLAYWIFDTLDSGGNDLRFVGVKIERELSDGVETIEMNEDDLMSMRHGATK